MKCPILKQSEYVWPNGSMEVTLADCIKEECAWWYGGQDCCSLPAIANNLSAVSNQIYNK